MSLDMNEWLGGLELEDIGSCDTRAKFSSAFLLLLEGRRRLNEELNKSKLRIVRCCLRLTIIGNG